MSDRSIPLLDLRNASRRATIPPLLTPPTGLLRDALGRPLRDLRISVTDRCNFRCSYCMPKEVFDKHHRFLSHDALLSFEEITRLAGLFVAHGVHKIRLTGGEPLLRKGLPDLIAMLAALRTPEGVAAGPHPHHQRLGPGAPGCQALKAAGLQRLTVSLDALDDAIFRHMNDVDFPVAEVLEGLQQARSSWALKPIKVNMVVKRGTNDASDPAHGAPLPRALPRVSCCASSSTWTWAPPTAGAWTKCCPPRTWCGSSPQNLPLVQLPIRAPRGETAERWAYADGGGEIGVISSVTQAFCRDCNRARLSTEGQLYLCLFAQRGHDLRALLRGGRSDAEIAAAVAGIWHGTEPIVTPRCAAWARTPWRLGPGRKVEMSYIGG